MPVIRMDLGTTSTTPAPEVRASLLARLKSELVEGTEGGPVIFEIPLGTACFDVLVVWSEWAGVRSEDRTSLILEAYGDKETEIAQALGVTYPEAMEQQLLPYAVVSGFEKDAKFLRLACNGDEAKAAQYLAEIRAIKHANGGIPLPDGRVELRFPTRVMANRTYERLREETGGFYWSIVIDAVVST